MTNRSEPVIADNNGLYIFGECKHCGEPQGVISTGNNKLPDEQRCYCRGADGLSFRIKCCYILKCIEKKGYLCDLDAPKSKVYPVKPWNVIVKEIAFQNEKHGDE
jgi:hypothetical protein